MSRFFFFLLGAGAGVWYSHTHGHCDRYRWHRGPWHEQKAEQPWEYHDNKPDTSTASPPYLKMFDERQDQLREKMNLMGTAALDTMIEVTEALRAKLAAAREEREAYRRRMEEYAANPRSYPSNEIPYSDRKSI